MYMLNWLNENNASDMFQYSFNRKMDAIHDFFVGLKKKHLMQSLKTKENEQKNLAYIIKS